ncbi:O-acetyltransferase [Lactococcus cremoris subsp. tructae]|uniref:Acetyltransferase n=1 Tax=Lactococcus cremoris subsp. tructae TaxID=542833 RepID=A0A2A5SX01_LACLC|nr:O-acetyltransferase [Lactococcus cremoris subsp. tructae]
MNKEQIKTLINSGEIYDDNDLELSEYRNHALFETRRYNQKINNNEGYQPEILRQLFEHLGENPYIESNFRCEFGFNIKIGDNVLINHDLIILDCNQVTIGDNVYFGPRCGLFAANHSEDQQSELLVGSIQSQLRLEIKSGWEQMSAFFQE